MIQRNDILGTTRAPDDLAEYLRRKGGHNLYNEPNYRLVWAPTRFRLKSGIHKTWSAEKTQAERGGTIRTDSGLLLPSSAKPLCTFEGVKLVRAYPFPSGWLVERWVPAHYYGDRQAWEQATIPGTMIPQHGPFPTRGDYEMCHYSVNDTLPTLAELDNVMDRCERGRDKAKTNVQQAVLERVNRDVEDFEKAREDERKESEAWMRDFLRPLYSGSLQMGALRSRMLEAQGMTAHNGN